MKRGLPVLALLAGVAAAALVALVLRLNRPPSGPLEPSWDRDACAHCRMHVSEPAFAAQVQTADGRVLFFDDPGCLFLWQAEQPAATRAAYFRHRDRARWLSPAEAGFLPGAATPMDWGFAAVDAGTPGALPEAEARRRVLAAAAAGGAGAPR